MHDTLPYAELKSMPAAPANGYPARLSGIIGSYVPLKIVKYAPPQRTTTTSTPHAENYVSDFGQIQNALSTYAPKSSS